MKRLFLLFLTLLFTITDIAAAQTQRRMEEVCLVDLGPESCSIISFNTDGNYSIVTANTDYFYAVRKQFPLQRTRNFNIYFQPAHRYLEEKARFGIQTSYVTSQDLFNEFMEMPDEQWGAMRDSLFCSAAVGSCGASVAAVSVPLVILTCAGSFITCAEAGRSVNKWLKKKAEAEKKIGLDAEKKAKQEEEEFKEMRRREGELRLKPDGSVPVIDLQLPNPPPPPPPLPTGIVTSRTIVDGQTVPSRARSD